MHSKISYHQYSLVHFENSLLHRKSLTFPSWGDGGGGRTPFPICCAWYVLQSIVVFPFYNPKVRICPTTPKADITGIQGRPWTFVVYQAVLRLVCIAKRAQVIQVLWKLRRAIRSFLAKLITVRPQHAKKDDRYAQRVHQHAYHAVFFILKLFLWVLRMNSSFADFFISLFCPRWLFIFSALAIFLHRSVLLSLTDKLALWRSVWRNSALAILICKRFSEFDTIQNIKINTDITSSVTNLCKSSDSQQACKKSALKAFYEFTNIKIHKFRKSSNFKIFKFT